MKKNLTFILVLTICVSFTGIAQGIIADAPGCPVMGIPYVMENGPICYAGPDTTYMLGNFAMISKTPGDLPPSSGGSLPVDSFFDVFTELSVDGGNSWMADSFFDVFVELSVDGGGGTFQTEIVSMTLSGHSAMPIIIRESPQMVSSGMHVVEQIPGTNLFHIDSFFDVFTELSVDGGQTWIPACAPMRLPATPEPTTIALLTLGGLILRRKKR
ncbi:MAG: PEP-CTERM sorting domain-containing protein [Sedimentisphaerales bacterium]|nr:PEP-CTERM sorting domain-containing protein [Sedimentisphaerales bacterium]